MALVGSGDTSTEALRGVVCGLVYGSVSPLIGHPLDSIKTRMQADAAYARGSAWSAFRGILRAEGLRGLYRGLLPPLVGSSIFRSVQFSTYAACQAASRESALLTAEVPLSGGMQVRVLTSGLVASAARALIETPLELIKVRRQMNRGWLAAGSVDAALRQPVTELRGLFRGFGVSFLRTWGLMGSFFVMVDVLERKRPDVLAIPFWGAWIKGAVCSTVAWLIVWPFEVVKNVIQAEAAANGGAAGGTSFLVRARGVVTTRGGFVGLYRGVGPGLLRALVANGASMVAFSYCQRCFQVAAEAAPR